jgi:hypothetical protein
VFCGKIALRFEIFLAFNVEQAGGRFFDLYPEIETKIHPEKFKKRSAAPYFYIFLYFRGLQVVGNEWKFRLGGSYRDPRSSYRDSIQ